MTVGLPMFGVHMYSRVKITYKFRHPECARPRALTSRDVVVCGMDMTGTIVGTVPDGQTHLNFAVYVCVDIVLVTYNTALKIVQPAQSVREASRSQTTRENEKAGQATLVFTFPFKATTSDCRLYIGNLCHIRQGIRGMIYFFPTATQWQTCPVLIAAVAFTARKIGVFFFTWV